jgi:hypothetical protein
MTMKIDLTAALLGDTLGALAFDHTGTRLAAAGINAVLVHDITSGRLTPPTLTFAPHRGRNDEGASAAIEALAFSRDGRVLAARLGLRSGACGVDELRLFDAITGAHLGAFPGYPPYPIEDSRAELAAEFRGGIGLVTSTDGERWLDTSHPGVWRILDRAGQKRGQVDAPRSLKPAAWLAGDRVVATAGALVVATVDLATGRIDRVNEPPDREEAMLEEGSARLVWVDPAGTLGLWTDETSVLVRQDLVSGRWRQSRRPLPLFGDEGSQDGQTEVAVSHDGAWLARGESDFESGTVTLHFGRLAGRE